MRMRWTVMRKYYWVLKRNALRSFLSDASEIVRSCSCDVRLFQETGPDTWKPLFPSVIVRVDGTTSWPDVADRRWARPGRDATDVQCLDKYPGARLMMPLKLGRNTALGGNFQSICMPQLQPLWYSMYYHFWWSRLERIQKKFVNW